MGRAKDSDPRPSSGRVRHAAPRGRALVRDVPRALEAICLKAMARDPSGRYGSASELAEEVRLPLPTVSKILKLLTREGLLESHRGIKGGYSLARPAEEISMAEIIACLEGPIAITECIDDTSGCVHEPRGRTWPRSALASCRRSQPSLAG